jgi:hypothetical protein
VHGLCCIATEVFFANDGAVSRLRCRSKVAQKVALHLWNAPSALAPPGDRITSESASCMGQPHATNAIKAAAKTPNVVTVLVTKWHGRGGIRSSNVIGKIRWFVRTESREPSDNKQQTGLKSLKTQAPSGGLFGIDQEVVTLRGLSRQLPGRSRSPKEEAFARPTRCVPPYSPASVRAVAPRSSIKLGAQSPA